VVGRVRLWSGLVLFAYLATHLATHALGLVSIEAMEYGRGIFLAVWRHPLGTLALYGALLAHVTVALRSLYRRRTLRMPAWEATQLGLGLLIPVPLIAHIVGTRLAYTWFDQIDSYPRLLLGMWTLAPAIGIRQSLVVVMAWVHVCIGLHFWLRLQRWYARTQLVLFAVALLLPVLALLGFAEAGRATTARASDPAYVPRVFAETNRVSADVSRALAQLQLWLGAAFVTAVALVLVAREARRFHADRRVRAVEITYPDGRTVRVPPRISVLEASRSAGIPHASICGGRGRCSTCRVRITSGSERLPPASPAERRVLARIGAPADVRLACQLRPGHDLGIVPLVPAAASSRAATPPRQAEGREQEVVVLFADLRGFTRMAEQKLPYDVVFFLNRYFEAVGTAVAGAGGITNQFTGDGVMALFGVTAGPAQGARDALAAARALTTAVRALGRTLATELNHPLALGIGVHAGAAVVGRMGHGQATYLTAVGDTVHVAARLEELTKTYECQLVISEDVATLAGLDVSPFPRHEITLRNRRQPLAIRVVDDVSRLG
jgi:adenylate cyclase